MFNYIINNVGDVRILGIGQLGPLSVGPLEGLGHSVVKQRVQISRLEVVVLDNVEDESEDGAARRRLDAVKQQVFADVNLQRGLPDGSGVILTNFLDLCASDCLNNKQCCLIVRDLWS